jgi:antitoxin component YwqK of YwqJK toxin-antitoxin module
MGSRGWYENGQLEVEEQFVQGTSHGSRTRWYATAKKSEYRERETIPVDTPEGV